MRQRFVKGEQFQLARIIKHSQQQNMGTARRLKVMPLDSLTSMIKQKHYRSSSF